MLAAAGPYASSGKDTSLLREILEKAAARLSSDLKDQPEVKADLCSIIGDAYFDIGRTAEAVAMHRDALALYRKIENADPQIACVLDSMGQELMYLDDLTESEAAVRNALQIRKKLFGNVGPEVAASLSLLGLVLKRQGGPARLAEAEALVRESLAIQRMISGKNSKVSLVHTLTRLVWILKAQGRRADAEAAAREAVAICEQIGGDDPGFRSQTLHALSNVVQDQEEAESLARKSLDLRRAALGTVENQPDLAIMLHDLAVLLVTNGKDLNEAENLEREALAIRRAAFGDNHRETIASFKRLVGILKREGKSETLEALRRESPELSRTDRQAPQDRKLPAGPRSEPARAGTKP